MRSLFHSFFFCFCKLHLYSFLDLFYLLRMLSVDIFGWLVFLSSVLFSFSSRFHFSYLFIWPYLLVCVYSFFRFFSLIGYYKVLSIVSCAIYWLSVCMCSNVCMSSQPRKPLPLLHTSLLRQKSLFNRFVPLTSFVEVFFMYSGVHPLAPAFQASFGNVLSA